jgi:hypothetical protein
MDALYRSWKNTTEVVSVGVVAEPSTTALESFICIMNSFRNRRKTIRLTRILFGDSLIVQPFLGVDRPRRQASRDQICR